MKTPAAKAKRTSVYSLLKLSETLAALFRFAPDAMVLIDSAGRIAQVNDRVEMLFGYSSNDLTGRSIGLLIPVDADKLHPKIRLPEIAAPLELFGQTRDGNSFPVEILISPVETRDGGCVIATVRDVTQRKRTEEDLRLARLSLKKREKLAELARVNAALREDAERLSAIIATQREIAGKGREFAPVLSRIAEQTQHLTSASGVAIDLIEQNELVSRTATGIAAHALSEWNRMILEISLECFRTGEIFRCEDAEADSRLNPAICRQVGLRSMIVVPLYQDGPAAGVLKILSGEPRAFSERDVRVAQIMAGLVSAAMSSAALAESKKLASLAVLASGVAHEIRNPLTAIKARLFTHQKRLRKGSPEAEDGEFIGEEIGRLERIVREFLLFARPGAPQFEGVSAAELLREVCELLAGQMKLSDIVLTIADAVETPVRADRHQIRQVLINLIRNAAESIGQGGCITLRARARRVGFGERGWNAVALDVEDTGKGIPPELHQHLFDPFFTTKASGTGLGLSIATRIVEQHGGALRFETGVGTTFHIILPTQITP